MWGSLQVLLCVFVVYIISFLAKHKYFSFTFDSFKDLGQKGSVEWPELTASLKNINITTNFWTISVTKDWNLPKIFYFGRQRSHNDTVGGVHSQYNQILYPPGNDGTNECLTVWHPLMGLIYRANFYLENILSKVLNVLFKVKLRKSTRV